MDCREAKVLIHGYIDGELDAPARSAVESHLASCHACATEKRAHEALSAGLRRSDLAYKAPASLRARLERPAPAPRLRVLALAGSFAFAGFLLGLNLPAMRAAWGRDRLATEAVSAHARALASGHLYDVASSDRHTVKPWYAGKLDYAPPVVDLSSDGFPLAGGRLDSLEGKPVAALVYKLREHSITLFVRPAEPGASPVPRAATVRGFHTLRWVAADMEYRAVTDAGAAELERFSGLLKTRE